MKLKSTGRPAFAPRPATLNRKPRRAVLARSLSRERPTRHWSLLLPPSFPAERK